MATVGQQIAALKLRKSPEQKAVIAAEARRKGEAFRVKVEGNDERDPGTLMSPAFLRTLQATAATVRAGDAARPDPNVRIAQLRLEGKLPPVVEGPDRPEYAPRYSAIDALKRLLGDAPKPEDRVGYEPTPEEILGDEALPKPTTPPVPKAVDDDCPPANEVLQTAPSPLDDDDDAEPSIDGVTGDAPAAAADFSGSPYLPGDLSPEELAEIDRLNPRRAAPPAAPPVARPARGGHTARQRQRGR